MNISRLLSCLLLFSFFGVSVVAQTTADTLFIERLLKDHPGKFKKFLDHPDKYKIQILYTQIERDCNNVPSFKEFRYRVNRRNYFYCASLVKLPCCALSLQKMNELNVPGLNPESRMLTDSVASCQKKTERDSTSETGYPSLAHYIKRMLLISDNDAYSRVYEFLGQEYIARQLHDKGYPDAFILQRFDANCNTADNACTNPITFIDSTGTLLYHQIAANCTRNMNHPLGKPTAGKAFINSKGDQVNEPKDFSQSNFLALEDVTKMLRSIIFPESLPKEQRFNISVSQREFLLHYMSMLPRESRFPRYRTPFFYDSYKKYLIYGDNRSPICQDSLRIFNIVGQSYGFVSDVAYICDFKNKVEFMLSAVIYTNEDEIINDNKYEYRTVALPFMADLGKTIYKAERKRRRAIRPTLSEFLFNYK